MKFYKTVSAVKYQANGPRAVEFKVNLNEWPTASFPFSSYRLDAKIKIETLGPVEAVGIYRMSPDWKTWELYQVIKTPKPIEEVQTSFQSAFKGWQFKVEPLTQLNTSSTSTNASRSYVKPDDPRLYVQGRLPDGTFSPETAYTIKGMLWSQYFSAAGLDWVETVARSGVNTVRFEYHYEPNEKLIEALDALYKKGIKVIMRLNENSIYNLDARSNKDVAWYLVNQFKNHPAILMWETASPDLLDTIKAEDSKHAVAFLTPASAISSEEVWMDKPLNAAFSHADVIAIEIKNDMTEVISNWARAASKPFYIAEFQNPTQWDALYFDLSASRSKGRVLGGFYSALGLSVLKTSYLAFQDRYLNPDYSPLVQNEAKVSIKTDPKMVTMKVSRGPENVHTETGDMSGIQVGVLDETTGTRMRDIVYFNNASLDYTQALIDFYQSQPEGSIIVFAVPLGGGFSDPLTNERLRSKLDAFFSGLGSKEVKKITSRGAWIFAVKKGGGVITEKYQDAKGALIVDFTVPLKAVGPLVNPGVKISFTPGLSLKNVTELPSPSLVHVLSVSDFRTTTQYVDNHLQLNYNINEQYPLAGFAVDFDAYETSEKESADLSKISKVTLGISGAAPKVRVRLMDVDGHVGDFYLEQIVPGTERFWTLDLSLLPANVNRSKIQAMYFFVDATSTQLDTLQGALSFSIGGLSIGKPAGPHLDILPPERTRNGSIDLVGTRPAFSRVYVQGELVVTSDGGDDPTTWKKLFSLKDGLNTISIVVVNEQGVASEPLIVNVTRDFRGPVGSLTLEGNTLVTQTSNVTLHLTAEDGSGVDAMSFSINGGGWTQWEPFAQTKQLTLSGFGATQVQYRLRDQLGNEAIQQFWLKNVGSEAGQVMIKNLAELLADASVPPNANATFSKRQAFLRSLVGLTPAERELLYGFASERDRALFKMLVATAQTIWPYMTDDALSAYAKNPVPVLGFDSPDFIENLSVLETMSPAHVMAFMGLLSTPMVDEPSHSTWAGDSWTMVVMNARWNEFARKSVVGKLLLLYGNYPIPLTARYYFTWSHAPDIIVTFTPITFTKADLPDLQRLLEGPNLLYKTWAAKAIASIH